MALIYELQVKYTVRSNGISEKKTCPVFINGKTTRENISKSVESVLKKRESGAGEVTINRIIMKGSRPSTSSKPSRGFHGNIQQ